MNDTKLKGDIAEQEAIVRLMKCGFNVLKPIGDRLPYDLVAEHNKQFIRLQIKSAWYYEKSDCWIASSKRCKTNRRTMIRIGYNIDDFDFALVYIDKLDIFYIIPIEEFIKYGSNISFIENVEKRQRKPKSYQFRDAWNLLK